MSLLGKMSVEDRKKLIQLVKTRPVIWDPLMQGYRDPVVRDACWDEIMVHMDYDQDDLELLKRTWRHIRDRYFRHNPDRPYKYTNLLTFLEGKKGVSAPPRSQEPKSSASSGAVSMVGSSRPSDHMGMEYGENGDAGDSSDEANGDVSQPSTSKEPAFVPPLFGTHSSKKRRRCKILSTAAEEISVDPFENEVLALLKQSFGTGDSGGGSGREKTTDDLFGEQVAAELKAIAEGPQKQWAKMTIFKTLYDAKYGQLQIT